MSEMFEGNDFFNQPLDTWNVANVTDMTEMFYDAAYNQPLSNWDVSNVTGMKRMFASNSIFNQPINNWDVSNVTDMEGMFRSATSFNQTIDNWDVSGVSTMASMFNNATAFNQPLQNWDVSNVINMRSMFRDASSFNQDLANWTFNSAVDIGVSQSLGFDTGYFLSYSGLSSTNYDSLLTRFAQLELQNKYMRAHDMLYCDSGVRNYLVGSLGWTIIGDSISVDCPTNTILGIVIYDHNLNGCSTEDLKGVNLMLSASTPNFEYSTFTSTEGEYFINALNQTYNLSVSNLPSYFTSTPTTTTVTFSGTNLNENVNFCLSSDQSITDLNIVILPITEARPGFDAQYMLIVENIGTETNINTLVNLSFDINTQAFIESEPTPTSNLNGLLTYNLGTIEPLSKNVVTISLNIFAPPIINGGEMLSLTATSSNVVSDVTPNDNVFELNQEVINSFDPNDKSVLQGSQIQITEANEYLHNIIRFQNTGTASALKVRVDEVLDPNLDWATLRPITASHSYSLMVKNENELSFTFQNINLPSETQNAHESNGFIAYKIKPKSNIAVGDVISGNPASIFFDYNLPIITNAVSTEIIQTLTVTENNKNEQLSIYPNPTHDILNIETGAGIVIERLVLINIQGRELVSIDGTAVLSLANLRTGIYFVKIITNNGITVKRIVKS